MVVVRIGKKDLESMSGVERDRILDFFDVVGIEVKREDDDFWDLELYPDRPDLYSIFGLSRALRIFFKGERRVYRVLKSNVLLNVEKSVNNVRPYIGAALVRNLKLNDHMIAYIMDMQEKLHLSIGRDRKKIAIGIHDFDRVLPPFTYRAVKGNDISFIPLGMQTPMTPEEILKLHPKGIEYSHILSGSNIYPIITDSGGNVLSFPPIINGTLTQIVEGTKNIFIDVTGIDLFTVINAVNILVSNFVELGGDIYSVNVNYPEFSISLPDLSREFMFVSFTSLHDLVGGIIPPAEVRKCLLSMGYTASRSGNGYRVGVPPYRIDIMHPVDVMEDIVKAYGYERIKLSPPGRFSMGGESYVEVVKERVRKIMVGMGYIEVVNLTFTSPARNFSRFGLQESYSPRITNPVVEDQNIYRSWIFPMLMETLENNRHRSLPQRIFEVGRVYRDFETLHLGAVSEESDSSFTKVKGTVERILTSLGKSWEIGETNYPFLIGGRQASVLVNGKMAGFFGEVHPSVIETFNLGNPVTMVEIYLDIIYPSIIEEKLKF